ncbi:GNAT family N-acetyltransferase [Kallotenue papyrolyticum]|uniref:GNAT family N-acetyltransferase n=1 Tax=Kallotenue papyrolyticum TaxID=1325125 RepID=UPI00047863D4|nr:GNAT family N-acetyltransferase [Kallotenue papyrolyticum]
MTVRQATFADAAAIAAVHVASWRAAYAGLLPDTLLQNLSVEQRTQQWQQALTNTSTEVYVYTADQTIVGFVACGPSRDEDVDQEPVGEIYAIYLEPASWDKGYGAALLSTALDALKKRGFASATLWVLHNNQRAMRFYTRADFQPDGATKEDTLPGGIVVHEVRYRRRL